VLSSGAQSRHGRITTRMGTTDHIPITDHPPAAVCGTVTPGYPLASYRRWAALIISGAIAITDVILPPAGDHRTLRVSTGHEKPEPFMATTVTMTTRATTPDLAMRQIAHITVKRLTMFWAIPSHTTATKVGASGDSWAGAIA
jgi:hypothetical protein